MPPASFRFHLTMNTLTLGYVIPAIRAYSGLAPARQCSCRAYRKKENTLADVLLIILYIRVLKSCAEKLLPDLCALLLRHEELVRLLDVESLVPSVDLREGAVDASLSR